MKAYVVQCFCEPLQAVDREDPVPTGTEVVIEVQRSGVCHTDPHLQDGYYELGGGKRANLADRGIRLPLVMGHEVLGRLVAKGPEAPIGDDAIGRSFLVYPWLGCGRCDVCLRGDENLCAKPASLGVFRPGGYAERCLVPHPRYLVEVEGIEPALAATYACSGLTAFSALRKLQMDRSQGLLLIIGLGGVGMNALLIARALGHARIAVADVDAGKREAALAQGAELAIDLREADAAARLAEAGGVTAAIDFVGQGATTSFAVGALNKGGTCVVVGLFGGDITLPLPPLVQRAICLRGSYVGNLQELKELVALARSGRIAPMPVETVPFDRVDDALQRLRRGGVRGRLVLSAEMAGGKG